MSNRITTLCRSLRMSPAQKSVLMCIADRADDQGLAWPSIPGICDWTCLSRTAVIEAMKWLSSQQLIGIQKEVGRNNRCSVNTEILTRLHTGPVEETDANQFVTQTGAPAGPVRETDSTRPADGPPPVRETDSTRPADGPEASISTIEASAKHQTARSGPSRFSPGSKKVAFDPMAIMLPEWLPPAIWAMWVKDRSDRKKAVTAAAARLQIRDLAKARGAGHDPVLIIERAVTKGWQGLYPADDGSTMAKPSSPGGNRPQWLLDAGFDHIAEAQNARCHVGNAHEFRDGKRITAEAQP